MKWTLRKEVRDDGLVTAIELLLNGEHVISIGCYDPTDPNNALHTALPGLRQLVEDAGGQVVEGSVGIEVTDQDGAQMKPCVDCGTLTSSWGGHGSGCDNCWEPLCEKCGEDAHDNGERYCKKCAAIGGKAAE